MTNKDECDARRYAPATNRNREPILAILRRILPPQTIVLEVASGTGEHAAYFAPRLPCTWLPSDPDPALRQSITAWRTEAAAPNLRAPLELDARAALWPVETANSDTISAIICINMIHIAPWEACQGLFAGAQRILPPGGVLYLYGPFKENGQHTAPSNASFDASLRSRDPTWGVRDLETVVGLGADRQLDLEETIAMPANNLSVVFRRQG